MCLWFLFFILSMQIMKVYYQMSTRVHKHNTLIIIIIHVNIHVQCMYIVESTTCNKRYQLPCTCSTCRVTTILNEHKLLWNHSWMVEVT